MYDPDRVIYLLKKEKISPHMECWYNLMAKMVHTIGAPESEAKKAELRNRAYYRAVNKPYYIMLEEERLRDMVRENVTESHRKTINMIMWNYLPSPESPVSPSSREARVSMEIL